MMGPMSLYIEYQRVGDRIRELRLSIKHDKPVSRLLYAEKLKALDERLEQLNENLFSLLNQSEAKK